MLARDKQRLSVFAELRLSADRSLRLGLGREASRWEARLESENASLGQLIAECAVNCFEPGSHALIAGGAEERRRFLDWGVFHVEQGFLDRWRRYQRALKQRNSLLRMGTEPGSSLYVPWETELASLADWIHEQRRNYLDRLRPILNACAATLLPELGTAELRYRRGWAEDLTLAEQLEAQRSRDLARGHTSLGAHRADWSLVFELAPQREHLSRGQEKLAALGCMLAQARLYANQHGDWPIICLDDLASELDEAHQAAVIAQLVESDAQVLVTGTALPEALRGKAHRMFHVEQGQVVPLL
ncbi:MAG: DNA replication/repair protein RecF [Rhodanobacter sp.]